MQKIAIIQISEAGQQTAQTLVRAFGAAVISRQEVGKRWKDFDAFVFIGAMGICVRTIAPYIRDKHEDPAVVCIDSMGMNAISVLSGHIGGANDLAREVAAAIGAREVITTQSDNAGLWALDTFEQRFGWRIVGEASKLCNEVLQSAIYAFVNRKPTALLLEVHDEGTDYLLNTLPPHVTLVDSLADVDKHRYHLCIIVSPALQSLEASPTTLQSLEASPTIVLHFVPRVLTVGIGLAHHAEPTIEILEDIRSSIVAAGYHPLAIDRFCTIDVKQDEPVVRALQAAGETVCFYTADELSKVEVPNPSDTVQKHVGTPSVCEAAAILGANHGKLIVPKVKGNNWTMAVAMQTHPQQTHPQPLPTGRGVDTSAAEKGGGLCNCPPPSQGGDGGGSVILIPEFSWWYYNRVASECGGTFEMYPLHEKDDTFAYDVDEVIAYTNRVHPRMLLLASPNNPTGNSLSPEEVGRIMENIPSDTMVLIDEAYASFMNMDTGYIAPLVNKYSNLIISRTLSKFYGLPGLRCGFGFIGKGHEQFESYVNKYLGYNRFSEAVALAALDSDEHYRRVADDMEWGRQLYKRCLGQLPGFKVYKSVANFILIKYPEEKKEALQQALAAESYKIKFMTDKGLESCVRITLGRKEQTQAVCDIILRVVKGE